MKDRLTSDQIKILAREHPNLELLITYDSLRALYNEIFDRLKEYEVAEVKYGKWIAVKENGPYGEFVAGYRCSCCNYDADWSEDRCADVLYFTGAYCSNCGVEMDEKD